jgi:hypothetical protein
MASPDADAAARLVFQAGLPSVEHTAGKYDKTRGILFVGVWWRHSAPAWVRPRILVYLQSTLEQWEGLQGADAAVIEARRPYPGGVR